MNTYALTQDYVSTDPVFAQFKSILSASEADFIDRITSDDYERITSDSRIRSVSIDTTLFRTTNDGLFRIDSNLSNRTT